MRSWQNLSRGPGELTGLFVDCKTLATLAGLILVTRHTMRLANASTAVWTNPIFEIGKPIEQEIKASLVNDLWEVLRIEWMDMELQHLCFLRPGVIFQWNYSPRATDTTGITVLPCLYLSSGTPKTRELAENASKRPTRANNKEYNKAIRQVDFIWKHNIFPSFKGAVSRQSSSFCLILPITSTSIAMELKLSKEFTGKWQNGQTNMSPEHYFLSCKQQGSSLKNC